jgi:hypothetical protein
MSSEYHFRFSEDFLLEASSRYRKQLWWFNPFRVVRWASVIPLMFLTAWCFFYGLSVPAIILSVVIFVFFLGPAIDPWLVRRRFRKSPYHDDDILLTISDEGVTVIGRTSESRLKWASFTKARRFSDGLLLFQGPHLFNWLPDRAATDPAAISDAKGLARTRIADFRDV